MYTDDTTLYFILEDFNFKLKLFVFVCLAINSTSVILNKRLIYLYYAEIPVSHCIPEIKITTNFQSY